MRNDPRLIAELLKFGKARLADGLGEKLAALPLWYDGDGVRLNFAIDVDANSLRLIAEKAGAKLKPYPVIK